MHAGCVEGLPRGRVATAYPDYSIIYDATTSP